MRTAVIDGEHLTLEEVEEVAEGRAKVRISYSAGKRVKRARNAAMISFQKKE